VILIIGIFGSLLTPIFSLNFSTVTSDEGEEIPAAEMTTWKVEMEEMGKMNQSLPQDYISFSRLALL
jgi:hypothetical protein